ncbi:phage major capsid protein [Escherichia coli]|nr:phage major capsid protein [Escherichia coli]
MVQGTGTGSPYSQKGWQVGDGNIQTAASAAFTWKEMNALKHAMIRHIVVAEIPLGIQYATLQTIEEMEDGQKRPLWLPDIAGGTRATVLGSLMLLIRLLTDWYGKKFIFLGDFNRFIIRRVTYMELKRLVERYADLNQVHFWLSIVLTVCWKMWQPSRRSLAITTRCSVTDRADAVFLCPHSVAGRSSDGSNSGKTQGAVPYDTDDATDDELLSCISGLPAGKAEILSTVSFMRRRCRKVILKGCL